MKITVSIRRVFDKKNQPRSLESVAEFDQPRALNVGDSSVTFAPRDRGTETMCNFTVIRSTRREIFTSRRLIGVEPLREINSGSRCSQRDV